MNKLNWRSSWLAALVASLALAGCENSSGIPMLNASEQVQGPVPVVSGDAIEQVDLIEELLPGDNSNATSNVLKDRARDLTLNSNTRLAFAYKAFDAEWNDSNGGKLQRNRIQGRLLQASTQRCGEYIKFVRQFETEGEFGLGFLTTVLAGAGAIVSGGASQALAGAAAIASGVRAEFQQAFFSNLASHVIIPGIEEVREKIHKDIMKKRNDDLSLKVYTVRDAIGDAVSYHAHCSLITGIIDAALSIERADNPGVDAMNTVLKQMGETRSLVNVLAGKKMAGVETAREDLQDLFDAIQKTKEKKTSVIENFEKILVVPDEMKDDDTAKNARTNSSKQKSVAVELFETAFNKQVDITLEIADESAKLTKKIEAKTASKSDRTVSVAELGVQQAKIQKVIVGLTSAGEILAGTLEKVGGKFKNVLGLVKATREADDAEAALKKAEEAEGAAETRLEEAKAAADADPTNTALQAAVTEREAEFKALEKAHDKAKEKDTKAKAKLEKAKADAGTAAEAPSGDSG